MKHELQFTCARSQEPPCLLQHVQQLVRVLQQLEQLEHLHFLVGACVQQPAQLLMPSAVVSWSVRFWLLPCPCPAESVPAACLHSSSHSPSQISLPVPPVSLHTKAHCVVTWAEFLPAAAPYSTVGAL